MKAIQFVVILVVAGLLAGCEKKSNQDQPPSPPPAGTGEVRNLPPAASVSPAISGVQAPLVAAITLPAETKEQYIAATEKRFVLLTARIEELIKKSGSLTTEAKLQAAPALSLLRKQRNFAQETFDQFKQANLEGWTELKADFESAMAELEKAYSNAKSKLS